jgi:hypothetical protein
VTFPANFTIETLINFGVSTPGSYHNAGVLLRSNGQPDNRYDYEIALVPSEAGGAFAGNVGLYQHTADIYTTLVTAPVPSGINIGVNYKLKVTIKDEGAGVRFQIYVDDVLLINFLETSKTHSTGTVVLYTYWGQAQFKYCYLSAETTPGQQNLPFHDTFANLDPSKWVEAGGQWEL